MDGGEVAGLLAVFVFAVLVGLLALPIVKLGRVFDELRLTIRSINDGTTPLIDEVTRTVSTTNTQLEKVDGITSNVSDASANVSALSSLVASTVGQPLIKVASFSHGLRRAFSPQTGPAGATRGPGAPVQDAGSQPGPGADASLGAPRAGSASRTPGTPGAHGTAGTRGMGAPRPSSGSGPAPSRPTTEPRS